MTLFATPKVAIDAQVITETSAQFDGAGQLIADREYIAPQFGSATFEGVATLTASSQYLPPGGGPIEVSATFAGSGGLGVSGVTIDPINGTFQADGVGSMSATPTYLAPGGQFDIRLGNIEVKSVYYGDQNLDDIYFGNIKV